MSLVFILFLTLLTSVLAYVITRGKRTLSSGFFRGAIRSFFEWVGAFVSFMAVNVVLGIIIIVVFRGVTQRFIAVYDLEDPLLIVLSATQGFVFQQWWKHE